MKYVKIALVLALVPSFGLIGCAEQAGQEEMAMMDMEALGSAMAEMEASWEQAYEGGDAAAVAALYSEDAIYLPPYMEAVRGRAAVEARMAEQIAATSARDITIERTEHGGSGDLSYGIGTYVLEMQMGDMGESMTENGKYLTLAKRSADGTWHIYAHIWNTSMSEADVAEMLSSMAEMSNM